MDLKYTQEPEAVLRRIKFRKKLPISEILNLVVGVDCDRLDPKPMPKCYLQDALLRGRIGLDLEEKKVTYRAQCPIPMLGLGSIELSADYFYGAEASRRYSYGLQMASSGWMDFARRGEADVSIKKPLNERLGFEVHGHIKRPGLGVGGGSDGIRIGDGALQIQLKEANAIVYL